MKQPGIDTLNVDLATVDYLDSSALGMLLLLRENVESTHIQLTLVNSHGAVRQFLEVANFSKMFTLR
ncbi:hypothetical protein CCP3SC15_6930001 [Gammaproteobacteria bacterium]